MGVSGCGKTTIGQILAKRLNIEFYDGDDYHTPENVDKMQNNQPLTDDDRTGWLLNLRQLITTTLYHHKRSLVVACSALKKTYRRHLDLGQNDVSFIYLRGSYKVIGDRLRQRKDHYMPPSLLQSQFDALEEPDENEAITISIAEKPEDIIAQIMNYLNR